MLADTMTPDQYASTVVREALKSSPRAWLWHGNQTGIVRWGDALFPRTIWDWLLWRIFKFDKLVAASKI